LDLGTSLGVARVFLDGGLDAQTVWLEANIGHRTVGVAGVINRFAGPDSVGVCIEEPFSRQFSSVKALLPMLGAAVLACELAGLPWSAIHLARLKIHARGKGNAKKPEMQAAAKARWEKTCEGDCARLRVCPTNAAKPKRNARRAWFISAKIRVPLTALDQ
jgi:hypothetical protein